METNEKQISGLAIASLSLSCISSIYSIFAAVPGIICGHIAIKMIKPNSSLKGFGIARAGLIVGYFTLIIHLVLIGLFFPYFFRKPKLVSPADLDRPVMRDYSILPVEKPPIVSEPLPLPPIKKKGNDN